jgi:hypothetical protein
MEKYSARVNLVVLAVGSKSAAAFIPYVQARGAGCGFQKSGARDKCARIKPCMHLCCCAHHALQHDLCCCVTYLLCPAGILACLDGYMNSCSTAQHHVCHVHEQIRVIHADDPLLIFHDAFSLLCPAGILACLDGYMNIAMEQTEVRAAACRTALWNSCAGGSSAS